MIVRAARVRCRDGTARVAEIALGTVLRGYILGLVVVMGMGMGMDMVGLLVQIMAV